MTLSFKEVLEAEAAREIQDGKAAGRRRPKGGLTDLSHGATGDTLRFNPYTVVIEDEYNICDPSHGLVRSYIGSLGAVVGRIGQPAPIHVAWDRERRRVVAADDGCMLWAVRQAIEEGAEIATVAARVASVGYSPMERMLRSLISIPGSREPTVLEKAVQVQRLVDLCGLTIPQIANRIHTDPETVRQWLDQARMLPPSIRKMVEDGALRVSLACRVLKAHDHNAASALAELQEAQALAGDGPIRPRMVEQVRSRGGERNTPQSVLRAALQDSTIVHSPSVGLVTVTMAAERYEALQKVARTGGNNVDTEA